VTTSFRRRTYWVLFVLSLFILLVAAILVLPVFAGGFRLPGSTLPWSLGGLGLDSARLAAAEALLCAVFGSTILLSVLVSFRKTVSTEIFYFAFWALSCSFEAGRILVLRVAEAGWADSWMVLVTRAVVGARFAGYAAMLLSGLHAAGLRLERPGRIVAGLLALGLAIAATLPVDSGVYGGTLLLRLGYSSIEAAFALALAVLTLANFLVGASTTGDRGFRLVALGALALLGGQYLLVHEWRPELVLPGLALLAVGARLFISRLHAYYLWQ
jgi:hypothetical protein